MGHVLENYNGVSLIINDQWLASEKLELFTDASGIGFAGTLIGQWFQGYWPPSWQYFNIAIKELFSVVLALILWSNILKDKHLLILCDNEAVVYVISSQTSKEKHLMSLIRTMTVSLMRNNVILRAKHVPGKQNIIADTLSRFQDMPELCVQFGLNHLQSVAAAAAFRLCSTHAAQPTPAVSPFSDERCRSLSGARLARSRPRQPCNALLRIVALRADRRTLIVVTPTRHNQDQSGNKLMQVRPHLSRVRIRIYLGESLSPKINPTIF